MEPESGSLKREDDFGPLFDNFLRLSVISTLLLRDLSDSGTEATTLRGAANAVRLSTDRRKPVLIES
jgi:hypothetical protein